MADNEEKGRVIGPKHNISFSNYTEIAFILEQHHELFYRFYHLGYPIFTDQPYSISLGLLDW